MEFLFGMLQPPAHHCMQVADVWQPLGQAAGGVVGAEEPAQVSVFFFLLPVSEWLASRLSLSNNQLESLPAELGNLCNLEG